MASILDSVKALIAGRAATVESATAQYRGLVERAALHKAKPSDTADYIASLLAELAKTPEELAEDIANETHRQELLGYANTLPALQAELATIKAASRERIATAKDAVRQAEAALAEVEKAESRAQSEVIERIRIASEAQAELRRLDKPVSFEDSATAHSHRAGVMFGR